MPTPLRPKATVLQTAAVADLLLSHISDHQSLSTLVPCYLVVWVGDVFEFLSPSEPLKLNEGVVGRAGIEPAVPRLKVVCLTTRLPAHMALPLPRKYYTSHCAATRREYPDCSGRGFGGSSLIRTGNCEFCRLPSYRLTNSPLAPSAGVEPTLRV